MKGPRSDREAAIENHRYLCTRAARKFVRESSERCDLEQVAAIGLIKAVDRFDESQGTPFEAFAWVFILGELMHYVRDCERALRIPRRMRDLERRWSAAERELVGTLGRHASAQEVARALDVGIEEHQEVLRVRESCGIASVEQLQLRDEGSMSYTIDAQVDRWMLESAMELLTPLERQILTAIYDHDVPIVTLAATLGYSRRHVTRIHRAALDKLRIPIGA